jgi:hypothetical protein
MNDVYRPASQEYILNCDENAIEINNSKNFEKTAQNIHHNSEIKFNNKKHMHKNSEEYQQRFMPKFEETYNSRD